MRSSSGSYEEAGYILLQANFGCSMVASIDYFSLQVILCNDDRLQQNGGNDIRFAVLDGVVVVTGGIETCGNLPTHDGVNEYDSGLAKNAGILEDCRILITSKNRLAGSNNAVLSADYRQRLDRKSVV